MNMGARQTQFEALVHAYSADLYRYAVWLCRNSEQAEDIVQETFMRAWKALDSLQDHRAAKRWLITILRRENARRFERVQADTASSDPVDLDRFPGFDQGHGRTETFVLRRALAALPDEYREPLLLQVLGGYSSEEIAELLGIKAGAVMTRLSRARQKLRARLDGDDISIKEGGSVS